MKNKILLILLFCSTIMSAQVGLFSNGKGEAGADGDTVTAVLFNKVGQQLSVTVNSTSSTATSNTITITDNDMQDATQVEMIGGAFDSQSTQDAVNQLEARVHLEKLEQTITIPASQTDSFNALFSDVYNVSALINLPGPELVPVGVIDPTSISTTEANQINNVYTDLCYHNSSAGTVNKELPAIDLGASLPVSTVAVSWWTSASYMASNYSIQGSNDGTTFTDLATNLNSVGQNGATQTYAVSGSWQYLRVFCVQGLNATWCIISELEAFGTSTGVQEFWLLNEENFSVAKDVNSKIKVTNNSTTSADVSVKYIE